MKKLILSFTSVLLSIALSACMTEELRSAADIDMPAAQHGIDIIDPNANTADPDVKACDGAIAAEEPSAIPSEQEIPTVTTVSSTNDNQYDPPNNTAADPINTTPTNLNDPIPIMTFSGGAYDFIIQNNTQYEWGYGLKPYFDKYDEEKGVWLPVQPITDFAVIEIYCLIQPGGSSTYSLPIESYYGSLSAGSYRVGLLMRNHETETAEMIWYEFGVEVIECY